MKSLTIQIPDLEYKRLGLTKSTISFSELMDIINVKTTLQSLEKSIELAEKNGLSKLSLKEINEEVMGFRNAENNS